MRGIEVLGDGKFLLHGEEGHLPAFRLLEDNEVEIVGHHFGDLDGFLSAEAAALLVIDGDTPVTGGGNPRDLPPENFNPVPLRHPRGGGVPYPVNPAASHAVPHPQLSHHPTP